MVFCFQFLANFIRLWITLLFGDFFCHYSIMCNFQRKIYQNCRTSGKCILIFYTGKPCKFMMSFLVVTKGLVAYFESRKSANFITFKKNN